jgi:hypothetical protein
MKLSNLLQYLNESLEEQGGLYEDIDEIAQYPEGFNIDDLKAQTSFAAKARYIRSHGLDKLGAGSSRAVFVADPTTVIKVAKNKKGIEQNKIEAGISSYNSENAPIALVKDSDPDNTWIEAERARKAKPTDFKKIIGFPMEAIMKVLREKTDELKGNPPYYYKLSDRNLFNQIAENVFVNDVIELIVSHDLGIGDVNRISSWGVVNRNGTEHLVLVDYGLDMDLFNRLYKRW